MSLRKLIDQAINIVLPRYCLLCERRLNTTVLCWNCIPREPAIDLGSQCDRCFSVDPAINTRSIQPDQPSLCHLCTICPPSFEKMRDLWEYHGMVRDLIAVMKYQPSECLCDYLANRMAVQTVKLFPKRAWDLVVPVPPAQRSLRLRLFSPCHVLAKAVSTITHVPLARGALQQTSENSAQAGLALEQRCRNVLEVFAACSQKITGKRVLLIDDVITSGATSSAAAKALYLAGAERVDVYALARSLNWVSMRQTVAKSIAYARPLSADKPSNLAAYDPARCVTVQAEQTAHYPTTTQGERTERAPR